MATSHLYVPDATENPIHEEYLPKTTPRIQLPVIQTQASARSHAGTILFFMLVCSAVTLFQAGTSYMPTTNVVMGLILLSGGGLLFNAYRTLRYGDDKWCFSVYLPLALLSALLLRAVSPKALLLVTALFLLVEVTLINFYYLAWACAGFMARSRARRCLLLGRPKNLKAGSMLKGFCEAVVTYLSYNRKRLSLPGHWRSAIGGYDARVLRTMTLVMLLTLSVAYVMGKPIQIDGTYFSTLSPLGCIAVPFVVISVWLFVLFCCSALNVRDAYALQRARFSPDYWPEFVEERTKSDDPVERESIFLGTVECDGSPVLNPVDQLMKHAWIVGKTGSGKTTFLLAMIDQLVRKGDISIDYLDLKATSFEPLATLQGGVPGSKSPPVRDVKTFTLEHGMPSYLFDLFSQKSWKKLPAAQRAALVLTSLSLAYSPAYGQSWYRDAAYDVVFYVLDRHPDIKSWGEFAKRIQDAIRHAKPWELSDDVKHDGVHVQLILKRLAALSALNANDSTPKEVRDNAIDLSVGFGKPSYTYLALSASVNGLIAGEIGRLYASFLLVAAATTKERNVRRLLIIDEWQCMVTKELALLLEQARSLGIGVILANQTTAQLITPDGDLRPIVEGNTSLQAWLQITDDIGREQLRRLGGQQIDFLTSRSVNSEGQSSRSYSEYVTDRIPTTLSSTIGSKDQRYFLRLTDNAGYACYGDLIFVARSYFNQHKEDYEAYCKMPWPDPSEKTLMNIEQPRQPPSAPPAGAPVTAPKPPGSDSGKAERQKTNQLGRTRQKKTTPKSPST